MPSLGAVAPLSYYVIPEAERASRCELGSDHCAIDYKLFFVRGCLEIPVRGADEPLVWGVWVSLGEQNFKAWLMACEERHRSHVPVLRLAELLVQALPGDNKYKDACPSSRPWNSTTDRA
jgi:hypothetical protein